MTERTDPPEPLRRFAERNCPDTPHDRVVFAQVGEMRLKPDGRWLPFTAEQWMATRSTAFCWHARVKMAPLVTAVVEDAFEDGHGRLDVKIFGALPVAHDEGPNVDRGEIQRYLAELPCTPRAILEDPELRFDDGPDGSVRVWVGDPEVYVDLHFDAQGDVVRTYSETRPRGDEGPTPWEGRWSVYETTDDGLRVPRRADVAWLLPEGRFAYWWAELSDFALER